VKLESFKWQVPQLSGPEILLHLLELLEESRFTLRKLKIFHLFTELEKSQEARLLNFLQRLESIESFYLTSIDIKEALWVDLVSSFQEMKSLRVLGIGCLMRGLKQECVTKPLRKILQKKGEEVLGIDSSFRYQLAEIEQEPLDLKEIIKVNSVLRKVSRNVRELFNTAGLE